MFNSVVNHHHSDLQVIRANDRFPSFAAEFRNEALPESARLFNLLDRTIERMPDLLAERGKWTAAKLYTDAQCMHRLHRNLGRAYVMLHEMEGGPNTVPHVHDHPWSFAVRILQGCYLMGTGRSGEPLDSLWRINTGDQYYIAPTQCHFIYPVTGRTFSVVVKMRGPESATQAPKASMQILDGSAKGRLLDKFEPFFGSSSAARVLAGAAS